MGERVVGHAGVPPIGGGARDVCDDDGLTVSGEPGVQRPELARDEKPDRGRLGESVYATTELGGEAFVAMVQTTNLRSGYHFPSCGQVDRTRIRAIFSERQMGPGVVVVVLVG